MKLRNLGAAVALCGLVACGGGGGGGSDNGGPAVAPAEPETRSAVSMKILRPADPMPYRELRWFDVVVTNAGPDAATDVSVLASHGQAFSRWHVSCDATGGATCPAVPEVMRVASLPARGILRFRIFGTQSERGAATISGRVTASNDILDRPAHRAQVDLNAYSADLQVTGTAVPGELAIGAAAAYTMTVTNAGPDTATDVAIHSLLDANQAPQGLSCTAAGGAVCPSTLGTAMSAPSVPVGGSLRFSVAAQPWPSTVGPITNTLHVSALGDPHHEDNIAVATARVAVKPNPGSLVQLESDAGDFIVQGQRHVFDRANSLLQFTASGSRLDVTVLGETYWSGSFKLPGQTQLRPGTYLDLGIFDVASAGGLLWGGEGRSCSSVTGFIVVDQAVYSGSTPTLVDLRFEQRCDGSSATLRGRVRWVASDTTAPPGPISPPPADLWRAAEGATPAEGSYLYVRREPYDPLRGRAAQRLFTRADSSMAVAAAGHRLEIRVRGDEVWNVDFAAPNNQAQLQPGYYRGLADPSNPARGLLQTSLQACSVPRGWVVIDAVRYVAGVLASIDLRFEQRCYNDVAVFRGQLRWVANEATRPPGPHAIPAGLWTPPVGSVPGQGNYVYLESDEGDYVGAGLVRQFSASNTPIRVTTGGIAGHARVMVGDDLQWRGEFQGMNSLARLEPGLYFDVQRWPFQNPVKGGLDWSGESRACNEIWGWFVVDSVSYDGNELTALDVRFAQHCEYGLPALRGKVHWVK